MERPPNDTKKDKIAPFITNGNVNLLRYIQPVVTSIKPYMIEVEISLLTPNNSIRLVNGVKILHVLQILIII